MLNSFSCAKTKMDCNVSNTECITLAVRPDQTMNINSLVDWFAYFQVWATFS